MNMISTAFSTEMNASNQKNELVKKLTSAWEKRNSKAARTGGVSLMALSLAACGAEDDTPFTQADVTAAATAATAAAEAVAAVAATTAADTAAADAFIAGLAAQEAQTAAVALATDTAAADAFIAGLAAQEAQAAAVAAAVAAVDITSDNAAAVNLALRNAAAEAGAVTFDGQTDASLIGAIKVADNAGLADAQVLSLGLAGISTLSQLKTAYDNAVAPSAVSKFTLTTGSDTGAEMTAGTVAATFNSVLVGAGAAGTTLQAGDNLTGGTGSDTLVLSATGAAGAFALNGVQTASIEKLQITDYTNAGVVTIDTALMSGLQTVSLFASGDDGDVAISNLSTIIAAEMKNGTGDLGLNYTAAAKLATGQTQAVTVSSVTAGTFDADGMETIAITSTLVANSLAAVTGDALTKVTVAGDSKLTVVTPLVNTVLTVDGSASTGGMSVGLAAGGDATITGTSGGDTLTLAAGLDKNDTIDLGDGADTVSISTTANRTFVDHNISNVETVTMAVTTGSITDYDVGALDDSTTIGLTAATTDKDVTVNKLGAAQAVSYTSDSANTLEMGNIAVNLASDGGLTDSMTVNLIAKTNAAQALDLLTVDDASEGLALNVSGVTTAAAQFDLGSLVSDGAATITVTGSGNFNVDLDQAGTNVTTLVDASGATGEFNFTEGVTNNMTVKGSSGINTLLMGATLNNLDTIEGGANVKDTVSATVAAATHTAALGKFNISAVETLALTLTDAQISNVDFTNITGVTNTTIAASGTGGNGTVNLIGLGAGFKVSTTDQGANDFDGTINLTLADATGSADTATVVLGNKQTLDNFALTSTGVETVTIQADTALAGDNGVNVSGVDATTITLTGGTTTAGLIVDLTQGTTKLNKSVTTLDASAYTGHVKVDASVANSVGVNFKMGDLLITDANSDLVVGSGATTTDDTLSGNFAATDATAEFTRLSAIETYNLTFADGVVVTSAANNGIGDGDNVVETITLSGGNSLTTYTDIAGAGIDGTSLTSFDASGLGGKINVEVAAGRMDNLTVKGSTNATTDAVTYVGVNGLTATTGKAVTEGVEVITLNTATGSSVIDTASMTGVTTIAVENDQNITLNNVAAGVGIQLGASATIGVEDYTGALTVVMADATGSADTLTFSTIASGTNEDVDAALTLAGVETVTLKISADAAAADVDLNIAGVAATSLIVTGGSAAENLDLTNGGNQTLSGSTSSVDASAFVGTFTAQAETNTTTSFTANGGAVAALTGSSGNDVFTIGTTTAQHNIAGGGGADTLNITLGSATTAFATMEGIETYNITAGNAAAVVVSGVTSKGFNDTMVGTVTLTGGGSSSTFDNTDGIDTASSMTLFDASGYEGRINDLLFDADQLDATVTVIGGAAANDLVSATITGADAVIRMTGVETLGLTMAGTRTVDVGTYASGITKVTVATDTSARVLTLNKLAAGVAVDVTVDDALDGVTIIQAATTGTSDSQTMNVLGNGANEAFLVDMQGVETLNLKHTGTNALDLNLTNFDMDTAGQTNSLIVTGTNNVDIVALGADTTLIDASAMTAGGVDIDARTTSTALTYIGSTLAESVIQTSKNDAFNGGEAVGVIDTLDINFTAILGGIGIDLSSTTDQISTMDGGTNSVVTLGFESVDLAGYVGFGASVIGNAEVNTIVGTGSNDSITAGGEADFITGGLGSDTMTGGAGADNFVYTAAGQGSDTITDFTVTSDNIDYNGALKAIGAQTGVTYQAAAAGTAVGASTTVFELTGVAHGGTDANVVTALAATATATAFDVGDTFLIATYLTGGGAQIWEYLDADGANIAAGELTLLATLSGVAADALVTGDFI
jgi:hypothetical protein